MEQIWTGHDIMSDKIYVFRMTMLRFCFDKLAAINNNEYIDVDISDHVHEIAHLVKYSGV